MHLNFFIRTSVLYSLMPLQWRTGSHPYGEYKVDTSINILVVNLLFSTLTFWIAAKIYIMPRLTELEPRTVLLPILILHSLRHLGLMFLSPGATFAGVPAEFAYPAAIGDLLAAVLAVASIAGLVGNWRSSRLLLWTFSVEGSLDLIGATVLATIYEAPAFMGPAYWIPAFWVPALLVTHYIVFIILLRHRTARGLSPKSGKNE
jgi:hypothetical protein